MTDGDPADTERHPVATGDTLVDLDRDDLLPSDGKTVTQPMPLPSGAPAAPNPAADRDVDLDEHDTDVFDQTHPVVAPQGPAAEIADAPTQVSRRRDAALVSDSSSASGSGDVLDGGSTHPDSTRVDVPVAQRAPQVDDVFTDSYLATDPERPTVAQSSPTMVETQQFRLNEVVAPPRMRDVAKPVDVALGGYHVHHYLGSGGMSVVYLARAPDSDHDVVIKRVRPERLSDPRHVGRFAEEARVALQLSHPNIVRTLDHSRDGLESFIVMEFLDGYDLRQMAKRLWAANRTLPIEPVLVALAQAARGLDYAHKWAGAKGDGEGLVHRDVSPENLFLTEEGVIKVVDFGLALAWDSKRFSSTGEVMGKVPYLSPEAVNGLKLDGRSDVFSLCVTAWWLLTGRRPFKRESAVLTLRAILDDEPKSLRGMNPRLPPSVSAILMKGLEKDRRWRYAEARDLADALDDAAAEANLPDDALKQLLYAADSVAPAPDTVTAPNPPAVPWREWIRDAQD